MFDIIILSYAQNSDAAQVTQNCIKSYLKNSDELINNIFVIESEKSIQDSVNGKVHTIVPKEDFNYNRFLNIGLEKCSSEFVIFSNNDIIVLENCLQTIKKAYQEDPELMGVCPIDRNWHRHSKLFFPTDDKLYYGYETTLHMFGCCITLRRKVFNTIGYLDERFFFFYQDNDVAECLRTNGLKHALHTGARVIHKEKPTPIKEGSKFSYTPQNMHDQGEIFKDKWNNPPYNTGKKGFKPFKKYNK